jgi:hypothetical protein
MLEALNTVHVQPPFLPPSLPPFLSTSLLRPRRRLSAS